MKQTSLWMLAILICLLTIISCFSDERKSTAASTVDYPAEPDYRDSTQWYITDRGAAADVFYIISTETGDYTLLDGEVCHYADTYSDSLRASLYGEMLGVDTLVSGRLNFFSPYYRQCSLKTFQNDSLMLLYTDGLNEAENQQKEQYGDDRIIQLLTSHDSLSARDLIEALKADTGQFRDGAEQNDDLTMLAFRVKFS